jgi:hypothetical protein
VLECTGDGIVWKKKNGTVFSNVEFGNNRIFVCTVIPNVNLNLIIGKHRKNRTVPFYLGRVECDLVLLNCGNNCCCVFPVPFFHVCSSTLFVVIVAGSLF